LSTRSARVSLDCKVTVGAPHRNYAAMPPASSLHPWPMW